MKKRRHRSAFQSLAVAAAVAVALALIACGGGSSSTTSPSPTPPPAVTGAVRVFPGTANVPVGGSAQLSAFLPSAPTATFSWSVSGSGTGTISDTGLYQAPTTIPSPAAVTITATDSASSKAAGTATITITAAPAGGVAINPAVVVVPAGGGFTFSATSNGNPVTPTWQVNGTVGGDGLHGTITSGGIYRAPFTPPPGGETTVTAESGGNTATATVVVSYSNASFSGPYAFSYKGQTSSGPFAVAGSFTANGTTGALAGLEDYNSKGLKTPVQEAQISGSFSVNPDGSATAMVSDPASSSTDTWQMILVSSPTGQAAPRALLVRFDSAATGSGEIDQQTAADFALSAFSGNYVFGLSGIDASTHTLDIAGKVRADGFGTLPVNFCVQDINDGGTNTEAAADTTLHGVYSGDANLAASGRGQLQLTNTSTEIPGTYTFAFYIVDNTHLKVVEIDTMGLLSGDFFSAPDTNGSFSSSILSGNYAFTESGTDSNGPYTTGGVMVANGSGGLTGGVLDINDGVQITLDTSFTGSSYTVDSNLGRIALSLTIGTVTRNYAAYVTSAGSFEIIELDTDGIALGMGFLQASTASLVGSFALNLSGSVNASGFPEEDVAGQVEFASGSSVPVGSIDINDAGKVVSGDAILNGSSIVPTDSRGRGTATVQTSSTTFPVAYYVVDDNSALLLETDGQRIMIGLMARQF
jgi:hypothetical protein